MSKYLKSNPDFNPWNEQDQENYLLKARDQYVRKCGQPYIEIHWRWTWRQDPVYKPAPAPKIDREYLGYLYDEGRILGLLRLSYSDFEAFVLRNPVYPRYYTRGRKIGHGWLNKGGTYETKGSSRYRKPKNHVSNAESSEKRSLLQTKQDWRDRKGFDRDHKKSRWKRSCPTAFRKISADKRRAYERELIHREDWDNYRTEVNHDFIDRWMWD